MAKINLKFQTVQKSLKIKPIQIMFATDQSFGEQGNALPIKSVTFFSQIGISFVVVLVFYAFIEIGELL
ncbi:hypothetical protein H6G35_13950 [Aulosira sp. FACHB-113]|uniref:hypothetical protein n=1 Tax=Tolypothrix tenuis TaxID=457083 RepID=UPI000BBCC94B|nr:hypothetical protein [Aulosira sp. FACHB-113]